LDGNPLEFPAGYPGVIGVGATARNGGRALYSETGPQVALVAPGGSADGNPSDDLPVLTPGGGTSTAAGTSFSAPQVAAAAALVMAVNPSLTPSDAGAIVVGTVTRIQTSPDVSYGQGMLNVGSAVKAATVIRRIAGPDRYATAAALTQLGWPGQAATVYVASGETFADALGTGAAAGLGGAPILLTNACGLPPSTSAQLQRLKPSAVFVVGGTAAVCDQVAQAITRVTGVTPTRIAGDDRYATNAQLVEATWKSKVATAFVTTGVNFPDGLTGSARASQAGGPLLLTDTCSLPAATGAQLTRLAPAMVEVIGGQNAVCPGVIDAIKAATGGSVIRLAGADRIQTGELVASDGWSHAINPVVANAGNFPDALTAGAFAALDHVPLLINDSCAADPGVATELQTLGATLISVAGGPAALCGTAIAPLAAAISH
jgi:putative cell wall-binding protein